jgi:hypothetical protein
MAGKKLKKATGQEDPPEEVVQNEEMGPPQSDGEVEDKVEDVEGDDEEYEPYPGCYKHTRSRTRSIVGRNLMREKYCDLRQKLPPQQSDEEEGGPSWAEDASPRPLWMAQVITEVSKSVRDEVKDIVAGSSREQNIIAKDLEDVKAAQKLIDPQAEASKLATEGLQMQFLAFGKVKAGIVNAIRLLKSHDILKAIKILEEVEQVAKLRLDVVRHAGSSPGQWPAAIIYEKKRLADT